NRVQIDHEQLQVLVRLAQEPAGVAVYRSGRPRGEDGEPPAVSARIRERRGAAAGIDLQDGGTGGGEAQFRVAELPEQPGRTAAAVAALLGDVQGEVRG